MQKLRRKCQKSFTLFILTLLISVAGVSAATFTVNQTGDAGDGVCDVTCTLRDAVLNANANAGADMIVFDGTVFSSMQTIVLTSDLTITNSTDSDVTITGPGANLLTVSGNNNSRVFTVNETPTVTITGMTLTGGNSSGSSASGFGGAIYNQGDLTIDGVIVSGNSSTNDGGGVYSSSGDSLTILNSTISNNNSADLAGGVHANNFSTLDITNSTISGNTSVDFGGGIYLEDSVIANIMTSTITDNESQVTTGTTTGAGGGIFNDSATLTLTDSTISNNRSPNGGGAGISFDVGTSSVMIVRSTISGNTSAGNGAGLFIEDTGVSITNSTISGNTITGTGDGGGIYRIGTTNTVSLSYTTVANNTATGSGGGINAATLDVGSSIIADNTDNGTAPDYSGTLNSQDYNLIEDTTGTTITGTTTNNITGQDPQLGPLADNTGPTETHALLTGSPAIDAADPGSFPSTDQRGVARPMNGNFSALQGSKNSFGSAVFGAFPDIGAFEALAPTAAAVSISGKVFSSAKGRGLYGAIVHLTDQDGNIQTVRTNPFGYYRIDNLKAGQTVLVNIYTKRFQFSPRVITVNESLQNINFFPQ